MRTYAILAAVLLGWGVLTADAQTSRARQLSDPSYSRHNYKHPQKAAAARSEDNQAISASTSTGMKSIANPAATRRNYKLQDRNQKHPDALLVLPGTIMERNNNPLNSPDNYKRQNQPAAKPRQQQETVPYEPMVNTDRDDLK